MRRLVMTALAMTVLATAAPVGAAEPVVPPSQAALVYSFAPLVKRVSPAVVNVYASRTVRQRVSPFMDDPFFRQFFGGGGMATRPRVQQSLGSGVIIDGSGVVVTNYHVIANADEVKVKHFNLARLLRDRIQQIPRKLAPQIVAAVVAQPDQRVVEDLLMEAIREALEELSR